jgi:rRNA processing/ribosome biogenesis
LSVGNHAAFSRDLNALLPAYFSSLLNLASQPTLLPATLKALHGLITDHPNAFRPSVTSANILLMKIFAGTYSPEVIDLAARIYVDIHHSASKGTNSEHWRSAILGIIGEAHIVLNHVFDSLEEGT